MIGFYFDWWVITKLLMRYGGSIAVGRKVNSPWSLSLINDGNFGILCFIFGLGALVVGLALQLRYNHSGMFFFKPALTLR